MTNQEIKTVYKVNALKYFHSGPLKDLSVDFSVKYYTLESATKAVGTLMKFTKVTTKDLSNNDVTYHCIEIKVG